MPVLSVVTLDIASASPGAIPITVPSGALGAVVFVRGQFDALSISSSFSSSFTLTPSPGGAPVVVATAQVTATGSQTITPSYGSYLAEGAAFFVAFVDGIDNTSTATWVRAVAASSSSSQTIASTTTDLVLAMDNWYTGGSGTPGPPPNESGWTSLGTHEYNNVAGRLRSANSPGASTTTATAQTGSGGAFSSMAEISIIQSSGSSGITVDLSVTDAADTLTSTAAVEVGVNLARTDASDTLSATATLPISVNLSRTDAADTLAATATLPIVANLSVTDASDSLAAAAAVQVGVNLSVTDAADTLEATAVVGDAPVTVDLAVTDSADTLSAAAAVTVGVSLGVTDTPDTLTSTSTMPVTVNASTTDSNDALAATAGVVVDASLAVTDEADTLAATATVQQEGQILVTLDVVDAADTLSATVALGPVPQRSGSGGRNWWIDTPVDRREVAVNVTDEDDTLVSAVTVKWSSAKVRKLMQQHAKALAPRGVLAQVHAVDDDDKVLCRASVNWPSVRLSRSVSLTRAAT